MNYDLFISYRHVDAAPVRALADGLRTAGLRVWIDERRIEDLTSIQTAIAEGLTHAKALVAWYSQAYPESRPCQCEFTAAFLPALAAGQALERILIINPTGTPNHIYPELYRDQKYLIPAGEDATGLVKAIQRHVAGLIGSFGELARSGSLTLKTDWYVREATSAEYFTGRLRELWRIHGALHADQYSVIHAHTPVLLAQVVGLGGMGKSLLAEEYGLRFASQYPGGIFWLNARDVMDGQLAGFAEQAGIVIEGLKPAEVRAVLGRHLRNAGQPYLWIVDDLPASLDEPSFKACLPPESDFGHTLITTRSHEYEGRGTEIVLEELTPVEALSLLTRQIQPEGEEEAAAAAGICQDLGGHPLALDVASRALPSFTARPRFTQYRERLNRPSKDELELAASLRGRLPNGHEKSITATLLSSYAGLSEEAKTLLRLATELARAPIPVNLAVAALALFQESQPEEAETALRIGLDDLTYSAFARLDAAGDAFQPHVLVTRTVRFKDGLLERQQDLRAAAIATLQPILEASDDIRQHAALAPYVPHARYLAEQPADEPEALLASWVAHYDFIRGDYRRARTLQEQALALYRRMLGEDHPDTLRLMNNLAATLRNQGELAGARALQEQVLAVCRRVLGEDHPATLRSMNNLAETLRDQGELAGARALQEQGLAVSRRVLGEDHPYTLGSMDNLALVLHAQGELAGARTLHEQVLAVRRRVLGEDHPATLTAMNNLAATLHDQGELAGARTLQEQVLAVSRRVLGEDHPQTLSAMNNLAATLHEQGELAGARTLHEQVLAVNRRVLGEDHPNTLGSMNNLALVLRDQGELAGARTLQEQALAVSRRVLGEDHPATRTLMNNLAATLRDVLAVNRQVLGEDHPDTLLSMNNLAATLRDQGELAEARTLQEQVLAVRRRVLGEDHPATLTAMNNLAATLHGQGELAGARTLHEQVLAVSRRVLGEDHPDTLTAMNNLAATLYEQGELAEARTLQEQVLAVNRQVLGGNHPDTLISMANLAATLRDQGELVGARALQEQVLAVSRQVLGEDHPNTLTAMNNLALVLQAQGELAGARALQEQVLAASRQVLGEDHPDTTRSAWNLFLTLLDLQEGDAAREILMNHLAWLFQADPQALSFEQQQILDDLEDMFPPEQS